MPNKFIINIKINIKKDAWNWWHACNRHSFGVAWRKRISKRMQNKLIGASRKTAYKHLLPYLQRLYKKIKIESKIDSIQEIFNKKKDRFFARMEQVTGKKIFRKDFTLILTTLPRAPYNYPKGDVWLPIVWPERVYVNVFLHELLHFQTYAYWRNRCLKKINNENFENLKEALTVILNDEFKSIMDGEDRGYFVHHYLRQVLLKYWKKHKNFDKLVNFGIKIYPRYKDTIKYLQFGKYVKPCPEYLFKKIKKIKTKKFDKKYVQKIFNIILDEFNPKKYKTTITKSFKQSRFTSAEEVLKRRQTSCGSMATVVASVFRRLGIPTKLVDGYFIKERPTMQHAWNEIYLPANKKFYPFDITKKDFKLTKYLIRKGEYLDWEEMRIK